MRLAAAALLATALLAGCASTPRAPGTAVPEDLALLRDWTASGRLALAAQGEGGSGTFVWRQREASSQLDLRGPFGAGALQIIATADAVSVADGTGRTLDRDATRSYLVERLGVDVPWDQLQYWLLGMPSPTAPSRVSESDAAPWRVIEQSGWRIGYDAFTPTSAGSLPQRFTASRDSVRVKVIVDAWTVPEEAHPSAGESR